MQKFFLSALFVCLAVAGFCQTPQLRKREYYIDTDPGPGHGIVTLFSDADSVSDVLSIPTTGLSAGSHLFYFRYADTAGKWGGAQSSGFTVTGLPLAETNAPRLIKREYFIDTDPGLGNGIVTTFAAADSVADTISAISTVGLASGTHTLYIRYADITGKWGHVQPVTFIITGMTPPPEAQSPPLIAREYFIDNDPGPGNGVVGTISAADSITENILSISTTGLASGSHIIYIRYKDTTGVWGGAQPTFFAVPGFVIPENAAPPIVKREYFIDTDPGAGNGIPASFSAADSVSESILSISTTGLAGGYHAVYIRYADSAGKWGAVQQASFLVTGAVAPPEVQHPPLAKREYFIDADPGVGNGVMSTVAISDSVADTILSISTVGLTAGSHNLFIRYADTTGVWGEVGFVPFSVPGTFVENAVPGIIKREYFIDTDPGVGHGTVAIISVADSLTDTSVAINTTGLSLGAHRFFIRYADTTGKWGQAQSYPFVVSNVVFLPPSPQLRKREYFIDTDPGPGLGIQSLVPVADSVADTITGISTTGLAIGYHLLHIRYADTAGVWGQTQSKFFAVSTAGTVYAEVQAPRIRKREYFIDTDPGLGNGIVSVVPYADSVADTALSVVTTGLVAGPHTVYIRYADSVGMWGQVQPVSFIITGMTPTAEVVSPKLRKREYFIDTDPGLGLGAVSTFTYADSVSESLIVATTGLASGPHTVYFRYADSTGVWGQVQPATFLVTGMTPPAEVQSPQVRKREYFIDTDPGQGLGTLSLVTVADSVADTILSIPTAGLSAGGHVLYIRYADTLGNWGLVQPVVFSVVSYTPVVEVQSPKLIKREYFIDTDPGFGNGVLTTFALADSVADTILSISTAGVPIGQHIIGIRYADSTGTWGAAQYALLTVNSSTVYVENTSPKIKKREYFFDTDPGFGNGTVTSFAYTDSVADTILSIPTTGLAIGAHALYIRYADSMGRWGQTQATLFIVDGSLVSTEVPAPRMIKREYFIDTDPGEGNGTIGYIAPTDSITENIFAVSTTGLTVGGHVLYIRYADSTNKWGFPQATTFSVINSSTFVEVSSPRIQKGEYFVDTDPGVGNGTSLTGFATADSVSINTTIPTTGLSLGLHRAYVRFCDTMGNWGLTTSIPINICTPIIALSAITAPVSICYGSSVTVTDTATAGTWSSSNTSVASITTGGVVTGLSSGTSIISYSKSNSCGSAVVTHSITVSNGSITAITATPVLCAGNSTNINVSGTSTYSWSPASGLNTTTGASVTASPSVTTTYTITGSNGTGCVSTATSTITVNPLPIITMTPATAAVCSGSSNTITASGCIAYAWSPGTALSSVTSASVVSTPTTSVTYTVTGYNASGCVNRATSTITVLQSPILSAISGDSIVCIGSATVPFTDTASGGVWRSSDSTKATIASSGIATGVSAGTVTISYTKTNSCFSTTVTKSLTVKVLPTITVGTFPIVCQGGATTSMPITATTGTPATYRIVYDAAAHTAGFADVTSAAISGSNIPVVVPSSAVAGTYNGTLTVANSTCSSTSLSFYITVVAPPAITLTVAATAICNGATQALSATSTGGVGTPVYTWSGPGITTFTGLTTTPAAFVPTVATTTTGAYSVSVAFSGSGCNAATAASLPVTVATQPVISVSPSATTFCVGNSLTLTESTTSGGAGTASYLWIGPGIATTTGSSAISPLFTPSVSNGAYSVAVSFNGAGCNTANAVTSVVNVVAQPSVTVTAANTAICTGGTETLTASTSGGVGTPVYTWSGPGITTFTGSTATPAAFTPTVAVSATRAYSVSVAYSGSGCTAVMATSAPVTVATQPLVTVTPSATSFCSGGSITLTENTTSGGAGTATYSWSGPGIAVTTGSSAISPVFTPSVSSGAYSVAVAYSGSGCNTAHAVTGTITVNSNPTITLSSLPSVCQGTASVNLPYTGSTGSPVNYSLTYDTVAHAAAFNDILIAGFSGGTIPLPLSTSATAGTYNATLNVSNGTCVSAAYPLSVTLLPNPVMSISSAVMPCMGYATNIVLTGTPSATVAYTVDGGSVVTGIITGGTLTLSTGSVSAPHDYHFVNVYTSTCSTAINRDTVINPILMTWVGGTPGNETDWKQATNWTCGFVPTVVDDIYIYPATYIPAITVADSGFARNLTIYAGGNIYLDNNAKLYVKGTLTNNSTLTGPGTVVLNGTTAQHIKGIGTIPTVTLNNALGATIDTGARLMVSNTLNITSGTLTTNDSLELVSIDSNAARIAPLPTSNSIAGKVTADQYVTGGYRRYRFWSHPFSTSISLSQVQQYIDITGSGGAANGFYTTATNAPSSFRYNPYVANDTLGYDPGWKAFTKINATAADSNVFHRYQGIRLFFRGAKGEGILPAWSTYTPSAVTVKMKGLINQGPQTVTLAQGATSPAHQSFNMVGNPYPSPVDIGSVLFAAKIANQVTGSSFYVWNPRLPGGGNYVAVLMDGTPYYLSEFGAFQVQAHHDSAVLHFDESNKGTTSNNYLFKPSAEYTKLTVYDASYNMWDMLRIKFADDATDNEDNDFDAVKILTTDFKFYSMGNDGRKLTIDARPYSIDKVIPLGVGSAYKQDFIIKADDVAVPAGASLYLRDKLLNKSVEMKAGSEYKFTITEDKATQGDNRFELAMRPYTNTIKPLSVTMTPNPANDDVKISFTTGSNEAVIINVIDMNGVSIYNVKPTVTQSGVVSVPLNSFAAGIYIVELTQGTQKISQRLVKE